MTEPREPIYTDASLPCERCGMPPDVPAHDHALVGQLSDAHTYRPSTPSTPRTGAPSEGVLESPFETAREEAAQRGCSVDDVLRERRNVPLVVRDESFARMRDGTPPDLGEIGTLLDALVPPYAEGTAGHTIRAELDRALASLQARAVRAERERDEAQTPAGLARLQYSVDALLEAWHQQQSGAQVSMRVTVAVNNLRQARAALAARPTPETDR